MKITAQMLCRKMLQSGKSAREIAQDKCVKEVDIKNWMARGVPLNRSGLMKEFYDGEL